MYAAIDIGGTNTRISIFENKKIIYEKKIKTESKDFQKLVNIISKEINKFSNIKGIGISSPGPADYNLGIFGPLPNLPNWENKNLKIALFKKTGIKNILMENDANLMALAHHHYFKNIGKITLFFTVSTGLGAGLILNDKIYKGACGFAMEVANAPVSWIKEKGKTLKDGALELFASGSGIEYRSGKTAQKTFISRDEKDVKIINDGIESLANMIATSVSIINPNMIVFDGSVARFNKWYIKKAYELAKSRSYPHHFKCIKYKIGELGDNAGLFGAYYLIKNS